MIAERVCFLPIEGSEGEDRVKAEKADKAEGAASAESTDKAKESLKPGETEPLRVEVRIFSTRGGMGKKKISITTN